MRPQQLYCSITQNVNQGRFDQLGIGNNRVRQRRTVVSILTRPYHHFSAVTPVSWVLLLYRHYTQANTSSSLGSATSSRLSMDGLNRLENKILKIVERHHSPKDILDVKEAFQVARSESQKKAQQPTMAVTDIPAEDLWDIFGLREAEGRTQIWHLSASGRRGVSSHLRKSSSHS